jgi:D-glycero-alpha-D-manno-heptose-7-phosphate kinase
MEELGYHLQMFYTRKKRDSNDIVASQVGFYKEKRSATLEALDDMKRLTHEMQGCLLRGQLRRFGELLHDGWVSKQKMNPSTVNPHLAEIYDVARQNGALGGKILGAGGGGFFLFYTPFTKKAAVSSALAKLGAHPTPVVFDEHGLQTWQVSEQDLTEETGGMFVR